MDGDIDLDGDIAVTEHLDRMAFARSAYFVEIINCDIATLREESVDC